MAKRVEIIDADSYPPLMRKNQGAAARMLRDPETIERGEQTIQGQRTVLQGAVWHLADDLEQAGADFARVGQSAHEIRNLAQNAGWAGAGRIADGLCRYLEDIEQLGLGPDTEIVLLHVSAVLRAIRNPNESEAMSETVAQELAGLVDRRIGEIKEVLG